MLYLYETLMQYTMIKITLSVETLFISKILKCYTLLLSFLFQIFSFVATYIVILIQFKLSESREAAEKN